MYNVKQVTGQRAGENAMNSLLQRAEMQNVSKVNANLFVSRTASESERIVANHQNFHNWDR